MRRNMDSMCIVRYGVVGKATALALGIKKHFDINGDSNITLQEASNCRYVFICLPTPTDQDGYQDVSAIVDIIQQIDAYRAFPIYIIRSTVLPGTADRIMDFNDMDRIISNPEFLSEDTASEDAVNPALIVIGGKNPQYLHEVAAIYAARFKALKPTLTDNVTAELIKYAFNTFFATKVVFANEIYDVAQKTGANYETIKKLLMLHPWGSKNHFQVFHKGGRGAKGKCLPKDLSAFAASTGSRFFNTVKEINDGFSDGKI